MSMFKTYASSMVFVSLLMLWSQGAILADAANTITVTVSPDYPDDVSFGIHCASGDHDLGPQTVTKGSSYSFKFAPNIWKTTLFHCGVSWQGRGLSFDIYVAKRDADRCFATCAWHVTPSGVAGYKEGKTDPDLLFNWK